MNDKETEDRERGLPWSKVAGLYISSFESARVSKPEEGAARGGRPRSSPELNLDHLYRMTDGIGIMQHATVNAPNRAKGYCTDDNARALTLAVLLGQLEEAPKRIWPLATTYAQFLHRAFDTKTKRFHNALSIDHHWQDERGSEDSHARALWALGTALGRSPHWSSRILAQELFTAALPALAGFTSHRSWALCLIGIDEYLGKKAKDQKAEQMRDLLLKRLLAIYDQVAEPGWYWFEESLTYDNAKLAHALMLTGRLLGNPAVTEKGLQALRWLVAVQTSECGQLRPIGNKGFYPRHGERAKFDQQPIEAQATVSACLEAYRATRDLWWYEQAQCAYDWFLGWNDLGLDLYHPETGGCGDGLHHDRVSENQGAESTLAFLSSFAEMRLVQGQPIRL